MPFKWAKNRISERENPQREKKNGPEKSEHIPKTADQQTECERLFDAFRVALGLE